MPPSEPRVLLADTDPAIRRQLKKRLLDAGIVVDCVDDARAAMSCLRAQTYSVLLIDVSPPESQRVLDFVHVMRGAKRPVVLVLADATSARSLDVEVVQIVLRKPQPHGALAELIQCCVATSARHLAARSSDSDEAIA